MKYLNEKRKKNCSFILKSLLDLGLGCLRVTTVFLYLGGNEQPILI